MPEELEDKNNEDVEIIEHGTKKIKIIIDDEPQILVMNLNITYPSNKYDGQEYFVYFEGVDESRTIMQNAFDGSFADGKMFNDISEAYGYANKIIRDGLIFDNGNFYPSPDTIEIQEKKINEENLSAIFSVLENI